MDTAEKLEGGGQGKPLKGIMCGMREAPLRMGRMGVMVVSKSRTGQWKWGVGAGLKIIKK